MNTNIILPPSNVLPENFIGYRKFMLRLLHNRYKTVQKRTAAMEACRKYLNIKFSLNTAVQNHPTVLTFRQIFNV